ncbi:shikimate dehydrogenase [Herpetosiphon giganteus]|uniref:shikimate dehydrogenase n=1 Tax=Herpetosiphon giganteus TaxID=2029754 RepID=UPI001957DAE9|nr:shikimate dehydrogenase [Herpetosiphon giganteus]
MSQIAALGIIGDPVAHSLSPAMHNAALQALAINQQYVRWHTPAAELPARVQSLRAEGMLGANVTLPHKVAIAPLLDRTLAIAQELGAVNTIVREADGSLTGHNTDAPALQASLQAAGIDLASQRAVILGAGGAARAALWALRNAGCQQISLINRTLSSAQALVLPHEQALAATDPHVADCLAKASLLINVTSLGWKDTDPAPLDLGLLHAKLLVYDTVYRQTPLLKGAAAIGAAHCDGLDMLVRQAGLAFSLWFNQPAPLAVMRTAALAALQG